MTRFGGTHEKATCSRILTSTDFDLFETKSAKRNTTETVRKPHHTCSSRYRWHDRDWPSILSNTHKDTLVSFKQGCSDFNRMSRLFPAAVPLKLSESEVSSTTVMLSDAPSTFTTAANIHNNDIIATLEHFIFVFVPWWCLQLFSHDWIE